MLPEYKAWASFIQTTIEQTSATAEMIRERVFILLSLISDDDMDVGELIYESLKKLIGTDKNTLGHSCLIKRLCQAANVPEEPSDLIVRSLRPITDLVMASFEREQKRYDRELREVQERQEQPLR